MALEWQSGSVHLGKTVMLLKSFMSVENFIIPEPWPETALKVPSLQAHRGYWLDGDPENSLASIRKAKQQGALMYECDVQLTLDKVPILFHDYDLMRFCQDPKSVQDYTLSELKQKFEVNTLEEVLCDPGTPLMANIELKTVGHLNEALERKVAEVVQRAGVQNRVLFSSFNPTSLWRIGQYLPKVPRALLISGDEVEENPWYLRNMSIAPFLSFHLLHLDAQLCTEKKMQKLQKNKIPFAVWTVNEKEKIDYFIRSGAVSVISDSLGIRR